MIDTHIWRPHPEKAGYLQIFRPKTFREFCDELMAAIDTDAPQYDEDYRLNSTAFEWFGPSTLLDPKYNTIGFTLDSSFPGPMGFHLLSTAGRGGSEGWITSLRIELIEEGRGASKSFDLLSGKTFAGSSFAWRFAQRMAELCEI